MAVTFVAATTALTATTEVDTTITCTTPSSTVNDVIIAWINAIDASGGVNPNLTAQDANWILIGTVADSGTPTPYSSLWYRIVQAGDDTTPTWTSTGGVTFMGAMVMSAYRGVDLTTPIATSAFDVIGASSTARTSASITTSIAQWILSGFADKTAGVAYTSPSGSLRGQTRQLTNGLPTVMIQDSNATVAPGTITQTAVGANTSVGNSFTLALKANRSIMPHGIAETFTGSNGATPSAQISTPTTNEGSGGALTIQGNQMRMRTGTTAFNRISCKIALAGSLADGEVVFDWVAPAWGTMFPGFYARAGSALNGDGGYYFLPSSTDMEFGKWVPNFNGVGLSTISYTFTTGVTYRTRIAIFGSRIRMRTWPALDPEATGSWDMDVTDSGTQPTTGNWGWTNSSGSAGSKDYFIDNVNLYDSVTPTSAAINPTGSITATSTLNKRTGKNFASSSTATGVLIKRTAKNIVGSITSTGALVRIRVVTRLFTGSITATSTLGKRISKNFASSSTATGVLVKRTGKNFASSSTATGVLKRRPAKLLAGSITPAGSTVMMFIGRVFGFPGIVVTTIRKAGDLRARLRRG